MQSGDKSNKYSIYISGADLPFYILGFWLVPFVFSLVGPLWLAKYLAAAALMNSLWLLVHFVAKWATSIA